MRKDFIILLGIVLACILSCRKPAVKMFTAMGSDETNISFANRLDPSKSFRVLYYFYYYNGGGVAIGDINKDGLDDIYFTANSKGANKLYLNKGNFTFEDITEKAGVAGLSDWCTGVTMADVNADGFPDIYVSSVNNIYKFNGRNELYINNKNGTFTERAMEYGLGYSTYATQSAFFDYDKDGDLDCYILNQSQRPAENLFDTSHRRTTDSLAGDLLLRNDMSTTGKFTNVSTEAGIYRSSLGYGLGVAVADFNNDGWEDIYVGNDFHENDYYYLNDQRGGFTESGAKHFNHYSRFSMGNDAADYDNDGQIDIITADMLPPDEKTLKTYGSGEGLDVYDLMLMKNGYQHQYSKNCLQHNNGDGESFSDLSLMNNVSATDWSWAPLFADFDNDGIKDLFISSGIPKRTVDMDYVKFVSAIVVPPGTNPKEKYDEALAKIPDGAMHNFVFKGNATGKFEDKSSEWGLADAKGYHNGAAYADLDNDGDLDLVVNALNSEAQVYRNNAPKQNYIQLSFQGDGQNTFGTGTKAYLFTEGKVQYQHCMNTRGFQSAVSPVLHFGLSGNNTIDSLLIVWPDQRYEVLRNVKANQKLVVNQKNANGKYVPHEFFPNPVAAYADVTDSIQLNWTHREDAFLDFNTQYLIPHQLSTRGPKIAVADVDNDGLDDFFVCGAKGQSGTLFMQKPDGKFVPQTKPFLAHANAEDVDAVFVDVNNDKFRDLIVVSGGNEYKDGSPELADRLYLNNGKGDLLYSEKSLPALLSNKSCLAVSDVDRDGDADVFIGGLTNAVAYGEPQHSYLLINDGKGVFSLAPEATINLQKIGMVTAAGFADMNNDGQEDLLVTGEWMPLSIYFNQNGKFKPPLNQGTTGLWQSLWVTDVNADGAKDVLLGNRGQNSKLFAGKNGPLKMYVKDFDGNGSSEQLMAYTIDEQEYPFLVKDELEKPLPVLKKKFLTYSEVAGKTIQQMMGDLFKGYTTLTAGSLSSTALINDGKGNLIMSELPSALQAAPVMSFCNSASDHRWIAAGNFFGVMPYEGRYDAMQPVEFGFDKTKNQFIRTKHLPAIKGEVRDIKWLRHKRGLLLVIARNNQPLIFLKPLNGPATVNN